MSGTVKANYYDSYTTGQPVEFLKRIKGVNAVNPDELVTKSQLDTATSAPDADTLDGLDSIYILNRANHTGFMPSSAISDKGSANGVASLDGLGKVPTSQLPASVAGAMNYQGSWNATTNTPSITTGSGTKGYYFVVSVAGTTTVDGINDWQIGDWIVYNGTAWEKIDNSDKVSSINGLTGAVTLNTDTVPEGGTNKYFDDALVSANADVAANTANRHNHANKALLDTYTQTEVDLADSVTKKHEHTNKAVLDLVEDDVSKTDGFSFQWDSVLGKYKAQSPAGGGLRQFKSSTGDVTLTAGTYEGSVLYAKNLNITGNVTIKAHSVIVEGNLTIDSGVTVTLQPLLYNPLLPVDSMSASYNENQQKLSAGKGAIPIGKNRENYQVFYGASGGYGGCYSGKSIFNSAEDRNYKLAPIEHRGGGGRPAFIRDGMIVWQSNNYAMRPVFGGNGGGSTYLPSGFMHTGGNWHFAETAGAVGSGGYGAFGGIASGGGTIDPDSENLGGGGGGGGGGAGGFGKGTTLRNTVGFEDVVQHGGGGNGGAAVLFLVSGDFTNNGTITANGEDSVQHILDNSYSGFGAVYHGGSGGGGGGIIIIRAGGVFSNSGAIHAKGGDGSEGYRNTYAVTNNQDFVQGGHGGGGGGVAIWCSSVSAGGAGTFDVSGGVKAADYGTISNTVVPSQDGNYFIIETNSQFKDTGIFSLNVSGTVHTSFGYPMAGSSFTVFDSVTALMPLIKALAGSV